MKTTTSIARLSKELMENDIEKRLKKSPNFILTNYIGLKANDVNSLRSEVRKAKAEYFVVKNRLCKRVFTKLKISGFDADIQGGVGITFISADVVDTTKSVLGFSKKHELLKVRSAYIDGKKMGFAELKRLSELPSKNVLLAMLLGTLNAPVTGFVTVLGGVQRKFVYVISAIKDKKNENK